MEEFGWVLFIAVVWVLSSISEFRKAQRKKQRREEREVERPPSRRRERDAAQTGPAAGRRDLAHDLEAGARRAEEALRRWEARQRAAGELPPAESRSAPSRRPALDDGRKDAYEAIAGMLAGQRAELPVPVEAERSTEVFEEPEAPDVPEWLDRKPGRRPSGHPLPGHQPPAHGALISSRSSPAPSRPRRPFDVRAPRGGTMASTPLPALERLGPLQQAVVWSEVLGPPVSLRDQGFADR